MKRLTVYCSNGETLQFRVKNAFDLLNSAGQDATALIEKSDGNPVLLNLKNIVAVELEDLT